MLGGDGAKPERTNNGGFCARWNRLKESQTFEMYGRLHSDICNVPLFLLNGVKIQIKLTKAKKPFYLLSDSRYKSHFQISRSPIVRQENPSGSLYSRITKRSSTGRLPGPIQLYQGRKYFHSFQTLCHYRQFGQRNMLSL